MDGGMAQNYVKKGTWGEIVMVLFYGIECCAVCDFIYIVSWLWDENMSKGKSVVKGQDFNTIFDLISLLWCIWRVF